MTPRKRFVRFLYWPTIPLADAADAARFRYLQEAWRRLPKGVRDASCEQLPDVVDQMIREGEGWAKVH